MDDIVCFFSGISCTGLYPFDLDSDLSGCIISKFNFANNSDLNGYFWLVFENIKSTIKESIISFNSPFAKWSYSADSGTGLVIILLNSHSFWWKKGEEIYGIQS